MFYDNLKAECEKQGLKLTPIVLECGGTKGIIGGWKNGAAPRSDIVMKLAVRLNVPTDYLLFGDNVPVSKLESNEQELLNIYQNLSVEDRFRVLGRAETLAELAAERAAEQTKKSNNTLQSSTEKGEKTIQIRSPEDEQININYYDMPSSAGTGAFLDHTHYEKVKIKRTPEAEQADFAIPIVGNSMEPDFHSGDVVLVKSCPYVNIGEIGIFVLDGDAFIKQYDGDKLLSLNDEYPPLMLSNYETAVCLGRVIGIAKLVK